MNVDVMKEEILAKGDAQINDKNAYTDSTILEMRRPRTKPDTGHLYQPLEENEIRVLEISPRSGNIEYRLKCAKLDSTTDYSAVSYTWGDPSQSRVTITIDGQSLHVTKNCQHALEELGREAMAQSKTYLIWIDAICINQDDIPERNRQILTMRNVYSRSKKLIVWLGIEADGSDEVIETMKIIAECRSKGHFRQWRESYEKHPRYPARWLSMMSFFSRSWFTRTWVIQEYIMCAKSLTGYRRSNIVEFYCGKSRLLSNVLERIVRDEFEGFLLPCPSKAQRELMEEQILSLSIPFQRGVRCFLHMIRRTDNVFYLTLQNHASTGLLHYILAGSDYGSTDPRDRIYAHLGLLSYLRSDSGLCKAIQFYGKKSGAKMDLNEKGLILDSYLESSLEVTKQASINFPNLIIDYNVSIEDVYSSLVLHMVSTTGGLNILSLCHRRSVHIKRTWTVDLTTLSLCESIEKRGGLLMDSLREGQRHDSFCASKGATGWIAQFSSDLSELTVRGIRVATIGLLLGTGVPGPHRGQVVFYMKHLVQHVSNFLVYTGVRKTNEAARRLLWKTWIGGIIQDCPGLFEEWCTFFDSGSVRLATETHQDLWYDIVHRQPNRTLFAMDNMMLGKGWNTVKEGDYVCVILGCDVPLVLRPVANHYELIGDCYIEGIMEGQAMQDLAKGRWELQTFNIH